MRYGKYFFISPEKIEGAERWAAHYGAFGIFASRLLPVVRHLIGIPAGIVRMNFWKILALHADRVGALVRGAVLAGRKGRWRHQQGRNAQSHVLAVRFSRRRSGVMYYFFVHRHMKAEKK